MSYPLLCVQDVVYSGIQMSQFLWCRWVTKVMIHGLMSSSEPKRGHGAGKISCAHCYILVLQREIITLLESVSEVVNLLVCHPVPDRVDGNILE